MSKEAQTTARPIDRELQVFNQEIMSLFSDVSDLTDQLALILGPGHPPSPSEAVPRHGESALADSIYKAAVQVRDIRRLVHELGRRLEI